MAKSFLRDPPLLAAEDIDLMECGEPLVEFGVAGRALLLSGGDGAPGFLQMA